MASNGIMSNNSNVKMGTGKYIYIDRQNGVIAIQLSCCDKRKDAKQVVSVIITSRKQLMHMKQYSRKNHNLKNTESFQLYGFWSSVTFV